MRPTPVRCSPPAYSASTSAARAQGTPVAGPYIPQASGVSRLPTSIYATDMLPASLSHPWVIVPRFSTAATGRPYGYQFSPTGFAPATPRTRQAPTPQSSAPTSGSIRVGMTEAVPHPPEIMTPAPFRGRASIPARRGAGLTGRYSVDHD